MAIERREILKLPFLFFGSSVVAKTQHTNTKKVPKGEMVRVVVVGGGFGGLTFAKKFKQLQKDVEVVVIDKNEFFMTGPMFNLMLGDIDGVSYNTIIHDRVSTSLKYNYNLVHAKVVEIDREKKIVYTTKGKVAYTYLVLSPGIAYDYEGQFSQWSKEKIALAKKAAPAALIPSEEFATLLHNLKQFKGGNIILSVPLGKYRCPPAPYERACMFAHYIKKHNLNAKVIVIDNYSRPVSKTEAFEEAFKELYPDVIEYYGDSTLEDVDFEKQEVRFSFWGEGSGDDGDMIVKKYNLLNIMVNNKASEVIKMAGIATYSWGSAKLKAPTYESISDSSIYVIGDSVGYPFPESGQMANAMGAICAKHLAQRIEGKSITEDMPGNMCISMVDGKDAISDSHAISFDGKKFTVTPFMPYDKTTHRYRSPAITQTLFGWYDGIMGDMLD